jgi:hypothetical protein
MAFQIGCGLFCRAHEPKAMRNGRPATGVVRLAARLLDANGRLAQP